MNSYFASVEQQANPFLRGKPVGVVATMTPNGCIIASSVEAKAKGIKTGCRVQDAWNLDPQVILIPNDSDKYRSCTENIFKILHEYTEDIEPYSIDEAFLDLTGWVRTFEEAEALGEKMRQRIQAEVGEWLKCSIGIGPTRWLAKFAGDTAPKGKTLVIRQDTLADILDPHYVTDAWGIAQGLEQRLHALNIYTLGELRQYPVINLMQSLHSMGYYLWAHVNGIELPGQQDSPHPKSIGHSHVFARRAESMDYPKAILAKLCEKAGRRMREKDLEAYGIYLHYGLRNEDSGNVASFTRRMEGGGGGYKLASPLYDTKEIYAECWKILTATLPPGALPNYLAMGLFNLKPKVDQLALWPRKKQQDSPALAMALDEINDQFGDFTVARGAFWGLTRKDAPDRVGFRKTIRYDRSSRRFEW